MIRFGMHIQFRRFLLVVALFVSGTACVAQAPVAARIAAQNALFEEIYQTQLRNSPATATALGDYRYNDQLDDESLAADVRECDARRDEGRLDAGEVFAGEDSGAVRGDCERRFAS